MFVSFYCEDGPSTSHPLDYLPNRHLVPRLLLRFVNEYLQRLDLQVHDLAEDVRLYNPI